uniref:VIT domain-containing protein n=1 Tax=Sphenodon punctatus TaxID=8508 RepID=A0A8D0HBU2_SPHPU
MPGLYCLPTWSALPLKSSCLKACANGYSLGLTAHLTYINSEQQSVEAVFIYALEESEVVASFEAVTGGRSVTYQIQNRRRAEDCCVDCSPSLSQPLRCTNGKCAAEFPDPYICCLLPYLQPPLSFCSPRFLLPAHPEHSRTVSLTLLNSLPLPDCSSSFLSEFCRYLPPLCSHFLLLPMLLPNFPCLEKPSSSFKFFSVMITPLPSLLCICTTLSQGNKGVRPVSPPYD